MFDWFFYIVAVLLAAPVVAVIALVRSIQLNKRLRGVELKLAMLERQSAPPVSSPPQAVARPPPAPPEPALTTVREAPISPVPPAPSSPPRASSPGSVPSFPQANATPAAHTISFEERFGTRWVVCGSVASHSLSAAYSWCVIQLNRVSSDPVFGFCWEVCLRSR